ncbi:hypothetical protein pb186bvf_012936 [Paramecium bursaria]
MIFKYENQDQVPAQLLCFICVRICETPFQCRFCNQLICFNCVKQSMCYNCKNEQYRPSEFLINHIIEMFRSHQVVCQVIHNDLKIAFDFLDNNSNDKTLSQYNNQDCSKTSENNSMCKQEEDYEDLLLKNEIKLICKYCNNIIQFVNAKQHLKSCLKIKKTKSPQCDSELNNDDFVQIYKYSLQSCIQNAKNYSNTRFEQFKLDAEFYMNNLDQQQLEFEQKKLCKKENFI